LGNVGDEMCEQKQSKPANFTKGRKEIALARDMA
jgi:hypothetical protein